MPLTRVRNVMIDDPVTLVDDYGADPTGVADSSSAFTAALAAGNYVVCSPGATYKVSDIDIPSDTTLDLMDSTIEPVSASTNFLLRMKNTSRSTLKNGRINPERTLDSANKYCVVVDSCYGFTVSDLFFVNVFNGLILTTQETFSNAIREGRVENLRYDGVIKRGIVIGLLYTGGTGGGSDTPSGESGSVHDVVFSDISIADQGNPSANNTDSAGVWVDQTGATDRGALRFLNVTVLGNQSATSFKYGWYVKSGREMWLTNCLSESMQLDPTTGSTAYYFEDSTKIFMSACWISLVKDGIVHNAAAQGIDDQIQINGLFAHSWYGTLLSADNGDIYFNALQDVDTFNNTQSGTLISSTNGGAVSNLYKSAVVRITTSESTQAFSHPFTNTNFRAIATPQRDITANSRWWVTKSSTEAVVRMDAAPASDTDFDVIMISHKPLAVVT